MPFITRGVSKSTGSIVAQQGGGKLISWGLGASAHFDHHYASIIAFSARQQRNFWVQRGPLLSLHMNFSPLPTVGAQW